MSDIPYSERPEWKDVIPIKQNDGPLPLVQIRYPPGFEETHDYFRAVQAANEYSDRALDLTADVIEHNSANYTAWYYRRRCLSELKSDLQEELELTNTWSRENAKNYQVWYHRRWLIAELVAQYEAAKDAGWAEKVKTLGMSELEYHMECMTVNDDFKNYNGWSHRQFVVQRFGLWERELEFVDDLLRGDIRNNSAWNHRYTVIRNSCWPLTDDTRNQEVGYTIAAIRKCANNESAWNYLGAFFGEGEGRRAWDTSPLVEALCSDVIAEGEKKEAPCRFAYEIRARILEAKGTPTEAIELFAKLKDIDRVRANYWEWRIEIIRQASGKAALGGVSASSGYTAGTQPSAPSA